MGDMTTIEVPLRGPYDVREVAVRQDADADADTIGQSAGPPVDVDRVVAQAARVVSADYDGQAYADLCRADTTLAPVFARAPRFRPASFYSPYEADIWSVVSARRPRSQGIALGQRLAETHGSVFDVAGQPVPVVPTPSRLIEVEELPGLPVDRIPRLPAIVEAVQGGDLGVARLASLEVAEAKAGLQRLPGIGPFYSTVIMVRGCELTDVMGEAWRPWRTWALLMPRALGGRTDLGEGDARG